jgi:two-component system LytT family response regulator
MKSKKLSACIIDDDHFVRNSIKNLIKTFELPVSILGEANSVAKGIELLQEYSPDLIFLDVEMPDGQGFDLLQQMPKIEAEVIFITAHNNYAVEAFRFSALDYLLKPIDIEDLSEAVQKAQNTLSKKNYDLKISAFVNNMEDISTKYKKMILSNSESIFSVTISDIIRLEANNNYTCFYVHNQEKPIWISKTLGEYEKILAEYGFFRAHQSHIINLNFLSYYDKKTTKIILKNNDVLPLANSKKDAFLALLGEI